MEPLDVKMYAVLDGYGDQNRAIIWWIRCMLFGITLISYCKMKSEERGILYFWCFAGTGWADSSKLFRPRPGFWVLCSSRWSATDLTVEPANRWEIQQRMMLSLWKLKQGWSILGWVQYQWNSEVLVSAYSIMNIPSVEWSAPICRLVSKQVFHC